MTRTRYRKLSLRTVNRILSLHQSGYKLPIICKRLRVSLPNCLSFILHDKKLTERYQANTRTGSETLVHEIDTLTDNINVENAQAIGLMVRSKQWLLSKYQPDKFGDKVQQEVSVKALTPVLNITLNNPTLLSHQNQKTGDLTIDASSDLKQIGLTDLKKDSEE